MREANPDSESGFDPTISEGIAQPARADASHASGRRPIAARDSELSSFGASILQGLGSPILLPSSFCPCGVVQPTCLPLMQEITGAKPVRDANFIGAWFTGNSRPT